MGYGFIHNKVNATHGLPSLSTETKFRRTCSILLAGRSTRMNIFYQNRKFKGSSEKSKNQQLFHRIRELNRGVGVGLEEMEFGRLAMEITGTEV